MSDESPPFPDFLTIESQATPPLLWMTCPPDEPDATAVVGDHVLDMYYRDESAVDLQIDGRTVAMGVQLLMNAFVSRVNRRF